MSGKGDGTYITQKSKAGATNHLTNVFFINSISKAHPENVCRDCEQDDIYKYHDVLLREILSLTRRSSSLLMS